MKYKSMEDLRNLSDKEVEDFLKKYWKTDGFTFYGEFETNRDYPGKYSGIMTKLKVPGSSICLKYPLSDIGLVSLKIPVNKRLGGRYYKFDCRLLPNSYNRCQLQILLNTLEEIGSRTYNSGSNSFPVRQKPANQSPLAHRYQILEDEATGWGKDISQLMGVYRRQHDGTYCLDDIRKPDLSKLPNYPKTTFHVGPLKLSKPIEGLDEGQYCLFNWKFTFKERVNPCEIEVDESRPIVFVSPKDFVLAVEKLEASHRDREEAGEKQADVCVLIYDLLHEANRYCSKVVDAQFYMTDKYISFQHTGRALSAETILDLCGFGGWNVENQEKNIAYHCQGLREFLLSNEHTLVISNGFTLRFDNVDGRLNVAWLEKSELPREVKISLAHNKRFTETVILPFGEGKDSVMGNYKVGLDCVFDDEQNIAFFSNIGKVVVKVKGGKTKTLDRQDWVVSREYEVFVPKTTRQDGDYKKKTTVMFACRHKDNALIGEEDSPVYSLIPTASSFGFPFLMQLDVNVNKTNYTINHRDSWNKVYAGIAGRLFAKWITDLTQKAEFSPESIYGIVPKFDECIQQHPDESVFIKLFQKGFRDVILSETTPQKTERREGKVYVIDTNVFVNCPNIISKMDKDDTVILSAKVIDELDNLKYKLEAKDLRNVQMALKSINLAIDRGNVRMEMSDISLLPRDFDRHNPDNNILSVAIRHKAEAPTLLTSDNGLQIKAKGIGVNVIGLREFLRTRQGTGKRIYHIKRYGKPIKQNEEMDETSFYRSNAAR